MTIHRNYPLKDLLFYKIGGKADVVLEAKSEDDIADAIEFIKKNKIGKWMAVGLGSNLLVHDKDYKGAIIWVNKPDDSVIHLTNDGLVAAYAGQTLDELIQFSFTHRLIGIEALGGLPSTVGGAIRGNAGAFGVEIKDIVEKVEVLVVDEDSYVIKELTSDECQFSYRDSVFKHNPQFIIIKGFFQFQEATIQELQRAKKTYEQNTAYRQKNHPVEFPSCGSVFKNIKDEKKIKKILSIWPDMQINVTKNWHGKIAMGYIIKRLGFSGLQVGGAKITEKHANYISNVDNATAKDVLKIIEAIRGKFTTTFGFEPELEAEIIK